MSPHLRFGGSAALLFLVVVLIPGCSAEQREALSHIQNAYNAVERLYPGATVNVKLLGGTLDITVFNSTFNEKPDADRRAQARRTAKAALDALGQPIDRIRVTFIRRRGFGVTMTATVGSYLFTAEELRR